MTTHFIADLHLDHEGVLAMSGRLFPNIHAHDEHMISQTNRFVGVNDRLFVLGDVAWHSVENYLDRLVCKDIHLIWGNHDRANFGKKFKTAEDVTEIKIGQKPTQHKVFLSHYPHAYWPSSHHGSFHLYGHCHRQREATLDAAFPGRRSLDVGVDNALHLLGEYRPFTEHEIITILGNRPGHDLLPFYDEFQRRLPKYDAACGFVPPTPGYAGCTREKSHTGPCAHEFFQERMNIPWKPEDTPGATRRQFTPKWTAADQAAEDARIAEIKRNRPNPPELLDFGGQSRP